MRYHVVVGHHASLDDLMTRHDPDLAIAFRRLTRDDLPLMHGWLNALHVRRLTAMDNLGMAGTEAARYRGGVRSA